jgi:hypothetical protein
VRRSSPVRAGARQKWRQQSRYRRCTRAESIRAEMTFVQSRAAAREDE